MQFLCNHCNGMVDVDATDAGQAVVCGCCGGILVAPLGPTAENAIIGGDFIISHKLAEGGMGAVYLAHQISLDRPAAVKVLHDEYASNPKFIEGFVREARAAARINHPNIVQAYAVGESEGLVYFAMEYIEGESLKQMQKRTPCLEPAYVLKILQDVARALDFAWKNQQLVHRDIKPENIMVDQRGTIKLADLGLAQVGQPAHDANADIVFGTPQYIPPEQYLNLPCDGRADIYSLGATAYHLLSGAPPYEAPTGPETAMMHLSTSLRPLRKKCPNVPAGLSRLVEAMMAKRPAHRYKDAADLLEDIARVVAGEMPRQEVSPLSQLPVTLEIAHPLEVSSIPPELAKKKTPVRLTEDDLLEIQRLRRDRMVFRRILYGLGGGLGVALLAFVTLVMMKNPELDNAMQEFPGTPKAQLKKYLAISRQLDDPSHEREGMAATFEYEEAYPGDASAAKLVGQAEPVAEKFLEGARLSAEAEEHVRWRQRYGELVKQKLQQDRDDIANAQARDRQIREAEAEAARRAKQLQAELVRAKRAKLAGIQDVIRRELREKCLAGNFVEAKELPALLRLQRPEDAPDSVDNEGSAWGNNIGGILDDAERTAQILANPENYQQKLSSKDNKGLEEKFPEELKKLAAQRDVRWRIDRVAADRVEFLFFKLAYDPAQGKMGERLIDNGRRVVKISTLSDDLARDIYLKIFNGMSLKKQDRRPPEDQLAEARLKLMAFLLVRGERLDLVRTMVARPDDYKAIRGGRSRAILIDNEIGFRRTWEGKAGPAPAPDSAPGESDDGWGAPQAAPEKR